LRNGRKKKSRRRAGRNANANVEPNIVNDKISANEIKTLDSPTRLHVHHIRARECDIDGLSIKAALDGLVACGVLPDDSAKHIKSIQVTASKGSPEKTIFTFEEL
jgi:hypothetical protein